MTTHNRYITKPAAGTVSDAYIADMQTQLPDWLPDDADPGVYWAEYSEQRELERIDEFNQGADANWIETATGEALDQLLNNVGYTSATIPANYTDSQKRALYYEAWDALDKDTPEFARRLAREANPVVVDASIEHQRTQNRIDVYLADEGGRDPGESIRTAVEVYMNTDSIPSRHPIWLSYKVLESKVVEYTVDATIFYRISNPEIEVRRVLEENMLILRKLNSRINQTLLFEGLPMSDNDGVNIKNIVMSMPAAELKASIGTVYHGSIGTLTFTRVRA